MCLVMLQEDILDISVDLVHVHWRFQEVNVFVVGIIMKTNISYKF